jgi:hypothetical protein
MAVDRAPPNCTMERERSPSREVMTVRQAGQLAVQPPLPPRRAGRGREPAVAVTVSCPASFTTTTSVVGSRAGCCRHG